jgi:hypothetical protein
MPAGRKAGGRNPAYRALVAALARAEAGEPPQEGDRAIMLDAMRWRVRHLDKQNKANRRLYLAGYFAGRKGKTEKESK